MDELLTYLNGLTESQKNQFSLLGEIYKTLNSRVNVVSRKDIDNIYSRHILHSVFIQSFFDFKAGSEILDLGTGGGFPGIPLAILYPETTFMLIDGTRKKIGIVKEVAEELGLKNVQAKQVRAEELKSRKFDFVVSRAVASVDKLMAWSRPLLKTKQIHAIPNGLFTWKGGDPKKEIALLPKHEYTEVYPLRDITNDPFFEEKYIMYVQG